MLREKVSRNIKKFYAGFRPIYFAWDQPVAVLHTQAASNQGRRVRALAAIGRMKRFRSGKALRRAILASPPTVSPQQRVSWICGIASPVGLGPMANHWLDVGHHRLRNCRLIGQFFHNPGEDAHVTSPLPAVVEGLRHAVFFRRAAPPKATAINNYCSTQNTPVINAWHTLARCKKRQKPRRLIFAQSGKIAHITPQNFVRLNYAGMTASST
jgi:hypothetical protein